MARRDTQQRGFVSPAAPGLLKNQGCEIVVQTPAGVARASDLMLNGYRTVGRCGGVIVDLSEFDYRQPLTQRVLVHLPDDAVNADFGPGRAMARYYETSRGEHATALSWYDGSQEVTLFALGTYSTEHGETNRILQRLMSDVVRERIESNR